MRCTLLFTVVAAVLSVFVFGCGGNASMSGGTAEPTTAVTVGTLSDARNGNTYKTVTIGGKTWMAENLNYQTGNALCYDNGGYGCVTCGMLYDWKTAMEACPPGWHLSTRQEWTELVDMVGGKNAAGKNLKSKSSWDGTDAYGFSALPCGVFVKRENQVYDKIGIWMTDGENEFVRMTRGGPPGNRADIIYDEKAKSNPISGSVRCVQGDAYASVSAGDFDYSAQGAAGANEFIDGRDERKYRTVKIGNYTWMAENLNYNVKVSNCYENKESNCQKYGRLYDWHTAVKACPKGWHLPSHAEWDVLMNAVGGEKTAGKHLKTKSGFSALPGGLGLGISGDRFDDVGNYGYWWSATEIDASYFAYRRSMSYNYERMGYGNVAKNYLFSVRCLQD